jgi:hypothetical protein
MTRSFSFENLSFLEVTEPDSMCMQQYSLISFSLVKRLTFINPAGIIFSIQAVNKVMKKALFILAALLCVAWIFGVFVFKTGSLVHVLMIMCVLSLMQAVIISPKCTRAIDAERAA